MSNRIKYEIYLLNTGFISCNCYLIKNEKMEFILVDTGIKAKRKKLLNFLKQFGVDNKNLKLIILTHGDFDHCANAEFISNLYNVPIAMSKIDSKLVESGNMFFYKTNMNLFFNKIIKLLTGFISFKLDILFKNDLLLEDYGFTNIKIIHLPGHTRGSIGVLVDDNLICGDLLSNRIRPKKYCIYNQEDYLNSINKLNEISINNVYPGHGKSFVYKKDLFN